MKRPVLVRGVGVVCALGTGVPKVREALRNPSATGFEGPSAERAAYPAPFDAATALPRGIGRRLGRQPAMALAAILEAVAGAGDLSDAALVLGTAHGAMTETVEFLEGAFRNGANYASPMLFAGSLHNAMAGVATRELSIRGPALVVCNGDTSFESALVVALALLGSGRFRRAVVGAADAWHPTYGRALTRLGLVSGSKEPTDFEMRRTTTGQHPGEGAGALVLECGDVGEPGVRVEAACVGGLPRGAPGIAEVQLLATGSGRSRMRHDRVLRDLRSSGAFGEVSVSYPAARLGAFGSLGAVAAACEAVRRSEDDAEDRGATLIACAPYGAPVGLVTLAGSRSR